MHCAVMVAHWTRHLILIVLGRCALNKFDLKTWNAFLSLILFAISLIVWCLKYNSVNESRKEKNNGHMKEKTNKREIEERIKERNSEHVKDKKSISQRNSHIDK